MCWVTYNSKSKISLIHLQYSSFLTWHSCAPYSCIVHLFSCVTHKYVHSSLIILHAIKMIHQMHRNFASKFSKQEPQDVAQNKPYLKFLYNTYTLLHINGFDYILVDNSNMVMLSMECRKWIITFQNNYCLTCYSISCRRITWHQKCCNCLQTKCCMCYYLLKW